MGISITVQNKDNDDKNNKINKNEKKLLSSMVIKPYFKNYILSFIISFFTAFGIISIVLLEKDLINFLTNKNYDMFFNIGYKLFFLSIGVSILVFIKTFVNNVSTEKIIVKLRNKFSEKLLTSKYTDLEKQQTGEIMTLFLNDIDLIKDYISKVFNDLLYQPIIFIISISFALFINWKLTVVSFLIIPISLIISLIVALPIKSYTFKQQNIIDKSNTIFSDAISGIDVLKAFQLESIFLSKFKKQISFFLKNYKKISFFDSLLFQMNIIIMFLPILILFAYGGFEIINNRLTLGELIAFMQFIILFITPLSFSTHYISSRNKAVVSIKRIKKILDLKEEQTGKKTNININYNPTIEFDNVSFKYTDEFIFNDLSFTINRGEKVVILGSSGSGKSTILKLLMGFYKVNKGKIKIFGEDINNYDIHELRKYVSIVPQDIFLFNESIRWNVKFSDFDNVTDEEIIQSMKKSQIISLINQKTRTLDTKISEFGNSLSGGEKQRLSIARGLSKSAEIFIFDESTSALDLETENKLLENIFSELKDKTIIFITHRKSILKWFDKKIIIENGRDLNE
ncbi:ABC transporter ATP-binding protein [Tepiditoga spiralis]|uniref:ABC transporter ATP-binding protein n=1 Tax=Tepiditoga spiralis TaxID=2108365 RepID=A0A7G1G7Y0_9BACT|nr:ABC transporter ATP-binding protein [Tepiditoga spiralis]BBE31047.1 ABC transporter ATP-binding protein [Tepiditoga spiralis]